MMVLSEENEQEQQQKTPARRRIESLSFTFRKLTDKSSAVEPLPCKHSQEAQAGN
jgi:hypothetical protein